MNLHGIRLSLCFYGLNSFRLSQLKVTQLLGGRLRYLDLHLESFRHSLLLYRQR